MRIHGKWKNIWVHLKKCVLSTTTFFTVDLCLHSIISDPKKIYSISEISIMSSKFILPLFEELVFESILFIERKIGVRLEKIPLERWYLIEHQGRTGGFYSKNSYGYCDIPRYSFTAEPAVEFYTSPENYTLEITRGYLHDLIHSSTFTSYAFKNGHLLAPKVAPTIFRYQHGINFRSSTGISYSAPSFAVREGFINLGILMDGIGSILSGQSLNVSLALHRSKFSPFVIDDVCCISPIKNGINFFNNVIIPTKKFFYQWPSLSIEQFACAMISGDIKELSINFKNKTGYCWPDAFKQDGFNEEFDM